MTELGDFEKFLLGGIIILAVIVLAFQLPGISFSDNKHAVDELVVGELDSSKVVGLSGKETSKVFSFGQFDASFESGTKEYDLGDRKLQSGVISGGERIEFSVSQNDVTSAYVEFTVASTNSIEPLSIIVNGKSVESEKYSLGVHRVELPASDNMKIEIVPVSSLWKIWAPNIYGLKDIKVSVSGFSKSSDRFFFDLGDEFDSLIEARIDFGLSQASGNIIVDVNGKIVYEGSVSRAGSVTISKNDLRRGSNSIAIGGSQNSHFSGDSSFVIFYKESSVQHAEIPFTLTAEEARKLTEVRIKFTVKNIEKQGGLSVKVYKGSELVFEDFDKADEKSYSLVLGKDQVREGANRVVIESAGGSLFRVDNADVKVVMPKQN